MHLFYFIYLKKYGKIFLVFTKEKVKRRLNFRPLLWLFFFSVVAIYSTTNIFLGKVWLFATFCAVMLCILSLFIISFFKKDLLNGFILFFNIKNLKIFFASLLVCGIVFSGLSAINFNIFSKRSFSNTLHSVNAVVREVVKTDATQSALLGDIIIDGEKQGFNIKVSCDVDIAELKVGDKIDLNMYLFENKLVNNGEIRTSIFKNKVYYYASITNGVYITDGNAHFVDYIKNDVKTLYLEAFDEDTAGFCFAVTMGDKSLLSSEYYQIFRQSGLAHILAVSGLHIGFLVAILLWITKKLKIKSKFRFWIVAFVLLVYNIICGFSPSVFRASIMSLCLMLGLIVGERNDSLSNLSLAGIIILLTQPLNLFDVGFLLSFSSVFGILFFQKRISNWLQKAHINSFVANPVALTISATIGTFPFVCKFFGYISPISILSNLIVLPLFTLFYYILLPSTILGLIFGPNLLVVAKFFANIVVTLSSVFAKFGTIDLIKFDTLCCAIYYFIIFFISPYFMLNPKQKCICAFALIFAFCPIIITTNTATYFNYNSVSFCEKANDTAFFTTQNNQKILLNVGKNKTGFANLKTMLSNKNVKQIDILILANYKASYNDYLTYVVNKYKIKDIVILNNLTTSDKKDIENICNNKNVDYITAQNFELTSDIYISTYVEDSKYKALNIRTAEHNYLFLLGAVSVSNLSANYIFDQSFDMVVTNSVTDLRYESLTSKNYLTFNTTICDNTFTLIDDLWTIKL